MIFGGYDESQFVGNLSWHKIVNDNWWALDLREIKYGNTIVDQFSKYDMAFAVIDTGTSLITLP